MGSHDHLIDYFVITAADVTAVFLVWLAGRNWFRREAKQWQKSGSLYWLGSDLMWTWMFARDGNLQRMNHGLRQAVHHATVLELPDQLLSRLKNLQESYRDKQEFLGSEKGNIIRELDDCKILFGKDGADTFAMGVNSGRDIVGHSFQGWFVPHIEANEGTNDAFFDYLVPGSHVRTSPVPGTRMPNIAGVRGRKGSFLAV